MARFEGEKLLSAFARAFISLEPDGDEEPLINNTLRGWVKLPAKATSR